MTVGLPGSGKSTWARQQQNLDPSLVLVSLDEIRATLFQSKFSKTNENLATRIQQAIICETHSQLRNIIVHNTHLNPATVKYQIEYCGFNPKAELVIKSFLDVPRNVCFERNAGRTGYTRVPDEVIDNMYNKWFDADGVWIGLKDKKINELFQC